MLKFDFGTKLRGLQKNRVTYHLVLYDYLIHCQKNLDALNNIESLENVSFSLKIIRVSFTMQRMLP